MNLPTPHIEAKKGEIEKIVLMSGDPLRAKYFAEKYLKNHKKVNSIRGMLAFSGDLNGKKVTIMGHGMGLESMGIYSYELYKFYDVDVIIRFGSCGSYLEKYNLFDVFVSSESFTQSNYGIGFDFKDDTIEGDELLLKKSKEIAKSVKYNVHFGKVNSSMWFYQEKNKLDDIDFFVKKGIEVVEMESFALYLIAKKLNKKALTILTISDNLVKDEHTNSKEREKKFVNMFDFLIRIVGEIKIEK